MKEWKDDKALFALIKEELYTAVVGDIMDGLSPPVFASPYPSAS